jgi:hypothetical protein
MPYSCCHPTFYVLPLSLQVFFEAESVVVAELSPEVVSVVAGLFPETFALVFVATGLSPEVVSGAAEPQVSVGIAVVFVVLVPVSVVVVEVDSSGRPRCLAFPNVDHFASPSSSVELVG